MKKRFSLIFFVSLLLFCFLPIGQGVSAEITFDIIEDFEEVFVPQGSFGQIPTGWTVIGSNTVTYSKGNEAYNGLCGLHVNATRYDQYYGVLVVGLYFIQKNLIKKEVMAMI